jgi:hypothetical protein
MNKRVIFFALITSLLVLISACSNRGGTDTFTSAPNTPFLGGSAGLFIEFEEGSPPEEVTDGGTFDFNAVVTLRNDGEFNLQKEDVKVDLIGILPQDFTAVPEDLDDKHPDDDLNARRRDSEGNLIEGTTTFVTLPNNNDFFTFAGDLKGNQEFTFRAEVCYSYQTLGIADLCVLKDLINVRDDVICDPSLSKTIHSSSAPVQVANYRQNVLGVDKVGFSFDIVQQGNGVIYKAQEAGVNDPNCPRGARDRRSKENRVLVTVDTGLANVRCTGLDGGNKGHVQLVRGRRSVTCTQELDPGRQDFERPIEIKLEYNYLDNKDARVVVKHLVDSP